MDCKILLTGAEGQLGNCLFYKLNEFFNVFSSSKNGNNKSKINKLDITDSAEVEKNINLFNPNIIINCAAITNVDFCEKNKSICYDVNVNGLKNLIKYSDKETKIIHISSDYVYDGENNSYDETLAPNPINYYGKTKLESENILIGSRRSYIIIRPSTLYSFKGNNFFTWVYNSLINNTEINVVDDQVSNPSFVPSLASSIIDMILMNGEGLYHHGSKDSITRYDFAIAISKKFNFNDKLIKKTNTKTLNQIARRPLSSILNCSKIENDFNIKMSYIDECLDNLYRNIHNA